MEWAWLMDQRILGEGGPLVGAIGLGCMGMSWAYAESSRDDGESIATIQEAIDRGVSLLDTADVYGDGHNESLLGRALPGRRDQVAVATKCGLVVDDLQTKGMHRDGSPGHIHAAVRASLSRLGTDVIDLYYLHRLDDRVPITESWGAMSELVAAGLVRRIGLSEVTVEQASLAHAIHPVAAIQSELSLWSRDPLGSGEGDDLVAWCREHGAAFVPFSPLGRRFLTGAVDSATTFEGSDFRAQLPRFTTAARAANLTIVDLAREVAASHGATPAQVALAWVLAQGEHVIPIPGTRRRQHLRANVEATGLVLTAAELARLDDAPAAVGTRF
jgi:aryl-alcohol dehydrogenase-like predicted oxidoreductase